MQISEQKVVLIHYTLTNDDGDILDSSEGHDPLAYIHGMGNIIPGLENALLGKSAGDRLKVSIAPEDGYGVRNEQLMQTVPKSAFDGVDDLEPGMQFQAESPEGMQLVTIVEVLDDAVVLDGNHPMAGMVLNFDVEVTEVRDASSEELRHGHVHGPGGHHH